MTEITRRHRVAAPGRVCLAGEGCDWMLSKAANWSYPKIQTLAEIVSADPSQPAVIIDYPQLGQVEILGEGNQREDLSYAAACLLALEARGIRPRGGRIRVTSTVPMCGGLSSSAALCTALVQAMATGAGSELEDHQIAETAYEAEQLMGIPCGRMDQYSVLHSDPVVIDSSANPPRITPFSVHRDVRLVVAYRPGEKSSFSDQYPSVKSRWQEGDRSVRRYIANVAAICEAMLSASDDKKLDAALLGNLVSAAHTTIVDDLDIANAEVDAWVLAALRAGAFGAKSCGARRRGGAMLAISDREKCGQVAGQLRHAGSTVLISGAPDNGLGATLDE